MFAGPGRREIQWKGEYREVVAPKRLVFTVSDRPGDEDYELVVVVFSDLGDGRTEMLFQQRGRMSAKQYERAGEGWSSFFDRMAEHLADAQSSGKVRIRPRLSVNHGVAQRHATVLAKPDARFPLQACSGFC